MNTNKFLIKQGEQLHLRDHSPSFTGGISKSQAKQVLKANVDKLKRLQNRLCSEATHAILLVFQGMDASGKDSAVDHIMERVNPMGFEVSSFKAPSKEEIEHDYLWRQIVRLPRRGRIGIFNRSHYEEVLVVRVHPEILSNQHLPKSLCGKNIWRQRFEDIRNFESYLAHNGIVVLKFFLNVSKEEQKRRFLEREKRPSKRWKFSLTDLKERRFWHRYMRAYEVALANTSTKLASWYVIPADNKWFSRAAISQIIVAKMESLGLEYPKLTKEKRHELERAKKMLKKGKH